MPIPAVIHQTWKTRNIPPFMRAWHLSWRHFNPQWTLRLWTDADNRQLVVERFPWLLPLYDSYKQPIMRVDMARCLILKLHGGVYADLDFECLKAIDPLVVEHELVLGKEPEQNVQRWNSSHPSGVSHIDGDLISNAWMASAAQHPFWDAAIEQLLRRRKLPAPVEATGPIALTAAWRSSPQWEGSVLLDSEYLLPLSNSEAEAGGSQPPDAAAQSKAYAVHHWAGTWWRQGAGISRRIRQLWAAAREPAAVLSATTIDLLRQLKRLLRSLLQRNATAKLHQPRPGIPCRALSDSELEQKIMIAVPVKNAAAFIPTFVHNVLRLSYPQHLLSVTFLSSDSNDGTEAALIQTKQSLDPYVADVRLFVQDFGYHSRKPRYRRTQQLVRRSILARSRNLLLQRGLRDEDWVLWIDVDVQWWPKNVLECLLAEDQQIIVPNCLTPDGRPFDLNSFRIQDGMTYKDWKPWIQDDLLQPPLGFGREYLSDLRAEHRVRLDGVGGAMLLVKAELHRQGLLFPEYPHRHYIETEGLAAAAADRDVECWGLPNLEIIHPRVELTAKCPKTASA